MPAEPARHQPTRPTRRLPVLVNELAIEDGQSPPPVVGEIGCFPLFFAEALDEVDEALGGEPDATVSMFDVRVEPLNGGIPRGPGQRWDGTPHDRPPVWPSVIHGDGWSAHWSAPRPVVGRARLRGTLVGDLATNSGQWVRGRVARARVVAETIDTSPPLQRDWRPIPGAQQLREVQSSPRWFDHGLVLPPGAPTGTWVSPVPADPYVQESGVLVDLDLDDVPPLPLRPSIVPGAIAAGGPDLWVADTRLPLVVRLTHPNTTGAASTAIGVVECSWPGRILTDDYTAVRALHPDRRGGCWVTGFDGVRHIGRRGVVRAVSDAPTGNAAVNGGQLLAGVRPDPDDPHGPEELHLFTRDGASRVIDLPDTVQRGIAAGHDGGFVVVLLPRYRPDQPTPSDPRPAWWGVVSADGQLHEPGVEVPPGAQLLDLRPPRLLYGAGIDGAGPGHRLAELRPDLTTGDDRAVPALHAGTFPAAGRHLWALSHAPDFGPVRGLMTDEDWWPLPGPLPADRPYRVLLTELDPTDMTVLRVCSVPTRAAHITTGAPPGAAWMLADQVYRLPPGIGADAEPLDVATLLDHTRRTVAAASTSEGT